MGHALFLPEIHSTSMMKCSGWESIYLCHSISSSPDSLPSSTSLPTFLVVELDLFAPVCGSGDGKTIGGRVAKEGWFLEGLERLESGRALAVPPHCLLVESATHFNPIVCLCEQIGSAAFWGSISFLDTVTIHLGWAAVRALSFPDIDADLLGPWIQPSYFNSNSGYKTIWLEGDHWRIVNINCRSQTTYTESPGLGAWLGLS